jgi:hypothetical protein
MNRGKLFAGALACLVIAANAYGATVVAPSQLGSSNLGSTIAVTDTFQSIQTYNSGRSGCLIQNQSTTNAMWVYFGPVASATKAKSFILDTSHGLQISCSVGGTSVLQDQVSITGTSTDAFAANFQ